ncbi:hypothetical protein HYALB_00003959 [Hymenoscyphus albidus]|uniref:Cas1p 10 TM acyl transferase domain-containing protein n=1 Tax=Hymenoscyphus albidus TaxID=595503 RepID=A0A9N9LWI7_9HELO|nr:hypothetical protein HYALB_00003959 [Hymenoscyphus albidus]
MLATSRLADGGHRILQFLLLTVIVGVVYRYCWIGKFLRPYQILLSSVHYAAKANTSPSSDVSDPFKCSALLNKGQWLDTGPKWKARGFFENWQPPGCIMHEYQNQDIQDCFRDRNIVFVGDSTTRQVFWAVAQKLDGGRATREMEELIQDKNKHRDIQFTHGRVTVKFTWDPWLNSTGLMQELKNFKAYTSRDADAGDASASVILLGAPGLWYARHGQENFFKDFRDAVDAVIPYMDRRSEETLPLPRSPLPSPEQSANLLFLAPVQVPRYQDLSPSREETIIPEKIDQMNDYLQQSSAHSKADVIWSYSLMTWNAPAAYEESGLHVVNNVALRKADVLLNSRCNADRGRRSYPFDATCCSNYVEPGASQWLTILMGMVILPVLLLLRRTRTSRIHRMQHATDILSALSIFALILCYCFYADRTHIFEKAHKQFHEREFLAACGLVVVAGLLSIQKIPVSLREPNPSMGFLSREQTDEWKGWMQFYILIYHYTHGSKILWIYEISRVMVAAYLFLTGFGHTLYFLGKEDYSLKRIANVLLRLNLLSCMLPYLMRTDYLHYYFAPLVSFWFMVIYATLRIGHKSNNNLYFLFFKICISAIFTTAFTMSPGIQEFVSTALKTTCNISWDVAEWRFRVFLDMFIVYVGMITAIIFQRSRKLRSGNLQRASMIDSVIQWTINHPLTLSSVTIILSLLAIPGFWKISSYHTKKQDYNWWNPYLSFIPILSYLVLRNCHRTLRGYYIGLFACLGRCSLETFVLQFHIWLAGDTTGLLRLGLWNRHVEAAILTPIFLWVSWGMAGVTERLVNWVVDGSSGGEDTLVRWNRFETRGRQRLEGGLPDDRLHFKEGDANGGMKGFKWNFHGRSLRISGLQVRLGVILVVMWVGNVTYR